MNRKLLSNGELKHTVSLHFRDLFSSHPRFANYVSQLPRGDYIAAIPVIEQAYQNTIVGYLLRENIGIRRADLTTALVDAIAYISNSPKIKWYERDNEVTKPQVINHRGTRFREIMAKAYTAVAATDPFLVHLEPESGIEFIVDTTATPSQRREREETRTYTITRVADSRRLIGTMTGIMDENPDFDYDVEGNPVLRYQNEPSTGDQGLTMTKEEHGGRVLSRIEDIAVPPIRCATDIETDKLRDAMAVFQIVAIETGRRGRPVEDFRATVESLTPELVRDGILLDKEISETLEERAIPFIYLAAMQNSKRLRLTADNVKTFATKYMESLGITTLDAGVLADLLVDLRRGVRQRNMDSAMDTFINSTKGITDEWENQYNQRRLPLDLYREKVRGLFAFYLTILPREQQVLNTLVGYRYEVSRQLSTAHPTPQGSNQFDESNYDYCPNARRLAELSCAVTLCYDILLHRMNTVGQGHDTIPGATKIMH